MEAMVAFSDDGLNSISRHPNSGPDRSGPV